MMPEDYQIASQLGLSENKPSAKTHKKKRDGLRKAPQAPKRFKSSYICFFSAKQAEIKAELGGTPTVAEVSRRTGEIWRELSTEERAYWDQVAAKDKQRYMVEKASYTGPWKIPWKRVKKDPSAPKRPMSAFLNFSQKRRRQIKNEYPELNNNEISKKLGELWRKVPEFERAPHIAKEKLEREDYKVRMDEWRDEHQERMKEERRIQAEQAQAALFYNTPPQFPQSTEAAQFNFTDLSASCAYSSSISQEQEHNFLGQQQQQPNQLYSFPTQGYLCGYRNPIGPQVYCGRQAVVLGPTGMPHFQPSERRLVCSQGDQTKLHEGCDPQQQVSYDFDDQGAEKEE